MNLCFINSLAIRWWLRSRAFSRVFWGDLIISGGVGFCFVFPICYLFSFFSVVISLSSSSNQVLLSKKKKKKKKEINVPIILIISLLGVQP